jgi:hypothetical protein
MVDFLLHFYRRGRAPFQSLSSISEDRALAIMRELYVEGSVFWERFKDPQGYLSFRKQVEKRLRNEFVLKGGKPKQDYPIYLVLGRPRWTEIAADADTVSTTAEIEIPLSILSPEDVSFTYPDSMVSALMAAEKNPEYYEPAYHGKVFTLREMAEIIEKKGLPGENWQTRMPRHLAHYIEAQVWNQKILAEHFERTKHGSAGSSSISD